jgi:hypothetical protein
MYIILRKLPKKDVLLHSRRRLRRHYARSLVRTWRSSFDVQTPRQKVLLTLTTAN